MKSTFIKASIVTATVSVVLATLGCSSGGSGGLGGAISSAFGGSDGYVISLPEAATTSLGKSTNKVGALGKITFDGIVEDNETITVPASAIIDRNNDGKLDENDTAIGFVMQAFGDAEFITPLTTLSIENNDSALMALAKDFDPVAQAKNLTADDNKTRQKAKAMIQLTEMVKTIAEHTGSTKSLAGINTTSLIADLNGTNSTDINVTSIAPVELQAAVQAKADTVTAVIATLAEAKTNNITIDASSLMVQVFDGGQDVNTSVTKNIATTDVNTTALYAAAALSDAAKTSADDATKAIDNISIRNLQIADRNVTYINGTVNSGTITSRKVDNLDGQALNIKFDVGNAISNFTSMEDGDSQDVNLTLILRNNSVDTINYPLTHSLTVTRGAGAGYDGNLSVTSNATHITTNGSSVTLDLGNLIDGESLGDISGVFSYILNFATDVNNSIINSNDNSITGTIDIGNTSVDKIRDDNASLSLASSTSGNLTLNDSGDRESSITWESNNTSVMEHDGTVVGSLLDRLEDKTVTITATLVNGDETLEKSFNVTVLASTDQNIVDYAYDELLIANTNLTSNIQLDTNMTTTDGRLIADISWDSNDTSILTNTGVITTSVMDRMVTLDANISRGSISSKKSFTLTVKADDTKIVEAAMTDLNTSINSAYTLADINSSVNSFTLPSTGLYASTITWESNATAVVAIDGNITGRSYMPIPVTLTATVTSNAASSTKVFTAQISPYTDTELVSMTNEALKVGEYDNTVTAIVSSNLALTTYNTNYDVNITWSSTGDTNTFTDATNSVIKRTDVQRDDVNLSAFIFRNDVNLTKDFNTSILASDAFIIAADYLNLTTTIAGYSDYNSSLGNLDLANLGNTATAGTTITWSGANITNGVLSVLPSATDSVVTVTATINRIGTAITYTQDYTITLKADADMATVATYKSNYDSVYTNKTITTADINASGYVTIDLNTTNASWTGSNAVTATTTATQNVSYTATFVSNNYSETSTYNYTIPADTNRAIAFSSAGITGSTGSLAEGSTREFSVVLEDGYGNVQAAKDVTFTATSGTMNSIATTDVNGVATATFTATTVGSASVTASYGSELTANFNVITDPLAAYNLHGTIGTDTMVGIGNNYNADGVIVYSNGNILSDLGSPPNAAEAYFDINSNNKTIAINSLYVGREFAFVDGQQVYYVTVTAEHVGQYTSLISN